MGEVRKMRRQQVQERLAELTQQEIYLDCQCWNFMHKVTLQWVLHADIF